jgi:hypothetical protein
MTIELHPSLSLASERRQRVLQKLQQIQQWPHWHEVYLSSRKFSQMNKATFDRFLPEYQRFMALCTLSQGLGMLGNEIDDIWHGHLLMSKRYRQFCTEIIGHMVDHMPCSSFELYGIRGAGIECEVPETCYDEGDDDDDALDDDDGVPATCYDPGDEPEETLAQIRTEILHAAEKFVLAYREAFECEPSTEFWPGVALPRLREGVAL